MGSSFALYKTQLLGTGIGRSPESQRQSLQFLVIRSVRAWYNMASRTSTWCHSVAIPVEFEKHLDSRPIETKEWDNCQYQTESQAGSSKCNGGQALPSGLWRHPSSKFEHLHYPTTLRLFWSLTATYSSSESLPTTCGESGRRRS